MSISMESPFIWVEGIDDERTLSHLLARHDIDCYIQDKKRPRPDNLPEFKIQRSVSNILKGMEEAMKRARKPIGFVLDADSPLEKRWDEVCYRLRKVGFTPPRVPPPEGFTNDTDMYKARVGVWLMPDNQHPGNLETFLHALIAENDVLINHADVSTKTAIEKFGAQFSEPDTEKAVLHAWLAWQKEPGRAFGTAIRAKYFSHDSPAAISFVAWFKKLYGMDVSPTASKSST